MTTYTKIGPVCDSGADPETVLTALMDALDAILEEISLTGPTTTPAEHTMWCVETTGRIDTFLGAIESRIAARPHYYSDDATEDIVGLCDCLERFAPPYCWFGAVDGAYGYWPNDDVIRDDIHDGDIIVTDGSMWPEDEIAARTGHGICAMVLEVNERGNRTLYTHDRVEVWSVV